MCLQIVTNNTSVITSQIVSLIRDKSQRQSKARGLFQAVQGNTFPSLLIIFIIHQPAWWRTRWLSCLLLVQMSHGRSSREAAAGSCQAQASPRQRLCGGDTGCRWPCSTRWLSGASGRNSSCSRIPRTCPSSSLMGAPSRCP